MLVNAGMELPKSIESISAAKKRMTHNKIHKIKDVGWRLRMLSEVGRLSM